MSSLRYCSVIPDDAGKIVREDRGFCPLKSVSVTSLIRDAVAQYTLVQSYVNPLADAAVEAVYTFPLYEGAAVCGFEAEVDGRKVVGRVQEKVAAREEYEAAKKAGKVASLLEEETPDTFQASVGNIPPSTTVAIRITLVSEIKQDGSDENQVRFVMPMAIAPRYGHSPFEDVSSSTVDTSATVLAVDMGCAMSKPITSIQSPSHTIEVHLGTSTADQSSTINANHARVSLTADALLECDLVIIVQALGLDEPRALVERHPKDGTHAISMTFAPRFALNPIRSLELIFIVDRSGSMDGTPVRKAGAALELFLRSIPCEDHYFNVIGFGSTHQSLFPKSVSYDADSLKRATLYAQKMQADMGGTEMMSAFEEAFKQRRRDVPLQIFLLTDGEIWDVESLCDVVREAVDEGERSHSPVRVFSLGIGDCVSHHLIESVARAGGGYAQLVMESERMEKKVLNMLKSALVPSATDLHVQWTSNVTMPDSADEMEEYVMVDAEAEASRAAEDPAPAPAPASAPKEISDPINLFSTSPEVPSPPPPPPALPPPTVVVPIHQAPFKIPILSRGARFTLYAILSSELPLPNELVMQGLSADGPVELKVKVEAPVMSTMLHSLAARAIMRDLEEGASCIHALERRKNPTSTPQMEMMLKRLGVHVVDAEGRQYTNAELSSKHVREITCAQILEIAMRYNLSSKYTSWVAVDEDTNQTIVHDKFEAPQVLYRSKVCVDKMSAPLIARCYVDELSDMDVGSDMISDSYEEGYFVDDSLCYEPAESVAEEESDVLEASYNSSNDAHSGSVMFHSLVACRWLQGDDEDQEEELMTMATDPHSRLRSILQHQSFDGSFLLTPEIAGFFSTTVEDLTGKLAERCTSSSTTLSSEAPEWGTIWATCLAVEFMKKQLPELQDEWELVVEKAEKRVEVLMVKIDIHDVIAIKEAAAVVAAGARTGELQNAEGVIETEKVHVETVPEPEMSPVLLPCMIGTAEPATVAGSGEKKST